MKNPKPLDAARSALLRDRNFLWMTGGGALSMLGDQFTLIALPWLVLQMTHDTRVLGIVLALVSVPRAAFILLGGAVVDRHSPRGVLMVTKYINTVLLGVLAALVLTGVPPLWVLYVLALGIGLSTAFSIPAGTSLMPYVVAPAQLVAANGIMLGLRQLSMFLGPVLAGLLIMLFGDGSTSMANATGVGLAFAVDAATFAVSAWTLAKVQIRALPAHAAPGAPKAQPAVLASVVQGLKHFWADTQLRTCFAYWAALAVLVMGPIHIAIPVLVSRTPGLGAGALGVILGAHGAGTLAGMLVSGGGARLRLGSLGLTVLVVDALIALLFMPMGYITAAWQGAALMALIGVLGGFMQVAVFTWIQQRVPGVLMGRAMSLFMFIFMGLAPVSAAVTGWLMRGVALPTLFMVCGATLLALAGGALLLSPMRRMDDALAPGAGAR